MRLQLTQRWCDKLARMPETGMGYQRVRVHLKAGRTIDGALVYNARILEVPDEAPSFRPQDIDDIEVATERSSY